MRAKSLQSWSLRSIEFKGNGRSREVLGKAVMMTKPMLPPILLSFTFVVVFFFSISSARDILTPSHPLANGETLISANGAFALGFFTPPNTTNRYIGIWFHNLAVHTVVWVANRRNPIPNLNATLSITADSASLRLMTSGNSAPLWSTPSFPNSSTNPIAQLLDTGNFVVQASNSTSYLWQSFDYPTNTLLSGMKFGPNLKTGIDRNLTSWLSPSDPSPGKYTFAVDLINVPQMVIRAASGSWLWRGVLWNSYYSISGPNQFFYTSLDRDVFVGFNSTPEEIYYYFNTIGDPIYTVTMEQNGSAMIYEWKASSKKWDFEMLAPTSNCDLYAACGTNAICDPSRMPICQCLDRFAPRNPVSWSRGNWSEGCVRVTALGCGANGADDDFMVVHSLNLPDTTAAAADMSLDMDGCRTRCLMNCSCKAYAVVYFIGLGNGCVIWMAELKDLTAATIEQSLYVRIAPSGRKRKIWIIVAAVTTFSFFLIILICIFMIRRRRGRVSSLNWFDEIMRKLEADEEGSSSISLFQFTQLVSATNNFSITNKLGEGGFGPVYKGELPNGQDVAIKRLSARSGQGLEELKNEILLIAKLQHRNLVRLLGFCIHEEEKMLIYELMPNKSLDLWLFNVENGSKLYWSRRFEIIEGIAQGLLYLHKHSRLRVIYRDLKASNILLDVDMNPRISDFGMARILDSMKTQANTRRIVGTYGYMSPEYAFNGLFSIKSDVFSFGVVLLEIVSGKRNTNFYEYDSPYNLLSYAWDLWKDGTWIELVDPTLDNEFRHNEVARCIYVALQCVQESPDDRPVMSDVISMLNNESLYFNHIKQPAFFIMKNASDSQRPPNSHVNNSSNGLSLSGMSGR